MPRKRSETAQTEIGTESPKENLSVSTPTGRKFPIEDDPSAICIALRKRGIDVPVSDIRDWAVGPRHITAMWIERELSDGDMPGILNRYPRRPVDGEGNEVGAPVKVEDRKTSFGPITEAVTEAQASLDTTIRKVSEPPTSASTKGSIPRIERGEGTRTNAHPEDSARHQNMREASRGETVELIAGELLAPPDTITVTWGREKIQPGNSNYSYFETPSLSTTVHLRPGEDKGKRFAEEYEQLAKLAEEFRAQKTKSFLHLLKVVTEAVGGGKKP